MGEAREAESLICNPMERAMTAMSIVITAGIVAQPILLIALALWDARRWKRMAR
jgi:hypothetical protein